MNYLEKELKIAEIEIIAWELEEEENVVSVSVNIPDDILTFECSCDIGSLLCPIHDK